MNHTRKIKQVFRSKPTLEGAGVHLKRAFGFAEVPTFDPFLLLDDFHSNNPAHYLKGFPWHPHRGIETITYVLHGDVEHGDSMGNRGVIHSGDVQWMTAGSGVIHQEMPKGDPEGLLWGFQLWANLPAANKMMAPRYRGLRREEIPQVTLEGEVQVRVICGQVNGVRGPVRDIVIDPQYLDVSVPPGSRVILPVKRGHTAFVYVFDGRAYFCGQRDPYAYPVEGVNYFDIQRDPAIGAESVVLFEDGDQVMLCTEQQAARFLLVSGQPIGEPIAWHGPIVMNTQQELRVAFDEYQRGTFIK